MRCINEDKRHQNGQERWEVEQNGEAAEREALHHEDVCLYASLLAQVFLVLCFIGFLSLLSFF